MKALSINRPAEAGRGTREHKQPQRNRPLRILMVLHMPWRRELGAARVSMELAEELVKRGHIVEKYDLRDAFPRTNRVSAFFEQAWFPRRAAAFVQKNAHKYDDWLK